MEKMVLRRSRFEDACNVLVTTQTLENYGAHDHNWDSGDTVDDVPQYWKFKGGHDILVCGVDSFQNAVALVNLFIHEHMYGDPNQAIMEFPSSWKVVGNDFVKGHPDTYEEWDSGRYVNHILGREGQDLEEVPTESHEWILMEPDPWDEDVS
jgi:hypothetical protein